MQKKFVKNIFMLILHNTASTRIYDNINKLIIAFIKVEP